MIGDLHIHSRFSRACSKDLTFENLVKWAKIKGLNLLGTGDFTHPVWFQEIKDKLVEKNGFYYYEDFPFILTSEISLVYTDKDKGRRVHLVYFAPSIEVVEKINAYFDKKGRRDYDGRPIFKISCEQFVKDMREISKEIEIIPAHIWTPWFGVFGSKGGYDSLYEAFGSQAEHINAIETGISSDPEMNVKIPDLKNKSIVSFSDAHSFWPYRLGREATIFHKTDSYLEILRQIRENDFIATIETDPAYGKYHYDGHRGCDFSCSPEKTDELGGLCPKCGKPLIVGVDYRVEKLAKEEPGKSKKYYSLLPLHEIISLCFKVGMNSKTVWNIYNPLIESFENEFEVLLNVSKEDLIKNNVNEKLIDLILKNRQGKIKVKPGYDGVYGKAILEEEQATLI